MREQLGGIFWLCIALFVAREGWKSEIGMLSAPGPGFLPFWGAVILGGFSIVLIICTTLNKKMSGKLGALWKGTQWGKVFAVTCSLFVYPLLLPTLGFVITTFGLMFFVTAVVGERSVFWHRGISAFLIVVGSYLVFSIFLDVKLPKGVFGF